MNILLNAIYRFNVIPIKLPMALSTGLEQKNSQFIWKHKRPWIAKAVLRKKNGTELIKLPDQIILQSYSLQDSMVLAQKQKYIPMEQKIESPEINPCTYAYLIFDKGGKNIQWGKDSHFNKQCWENWTATCKRMKLEHFLTPYTKINSKWIKSLNVIPEIIKRLEKNIGRTLDDINQSKILYDPPPRVIEIITNVNKWVLIELKIFCTAKEAISKVKRQISE